MIFDVEHESLESENFIFSACSNLYLQVTSQPIPKHVAIIMDGNRRWAKRNDQPAVFGHWRGASVLIDVVKAAATLGIEVLTVYSFSTENWARSEEEVLALMEVFRHYLRSQKQIMIDEGICLSAIGDLSKLPEDLQEEFSNVQQETSAGKRIRLVLAVNYGARDEMRRCVVKILENFEKGLLKKEEIDSNLISKFLDTADLPDPDLLIRTSGEMRLSNFLLWQLSYAEFFLTDTLWPDFSPQNLLEAVLSFQKRIRRRGGSL